MGFGRGGGTGGRNVIRNYVLLEKKRGGGLMFVLIGMHCNLDAQGNARVFEKEETSSWRLMDLEGCYGGGGGGGIGDAKKPLRLRTEKGGATRPGRPFNEPIIKASIT